MPYEDLRGFLSDLEQRGDLKRVGCEVDPVLEITEICRRVLRDGGPALLFENPRGFRTPVLGNLFGSTGRVAAAVGRRSLGELRQLGEALAVLRHPGWPGEIPEALEMFPAFRKLLHAAPRLVEDAPCRENIIDGGDVDLSTLPVQVCWPGDAGALITWGLVVTRGPRKSRQNVGIYRQQVIGRNKVILRWLPQRGGAADFRDWRETRPGERFPVAVAIGADPAMLIAAVAPVPDAVSEFQFAGLLRGARTAVANCGTVPLQVPARSEFVLEGYIEPGEEALEGPFGDHTGYYHGREPFPVLTVQRITHRDNPIYHSTYAGRSPYDEASVLAMALNEIFVPILRKQFPEIVDFYLPPEACSYRLAAVSIRKQFPGHARQIMSGIWSHLRQFTYTKIIIVTDEDINVRDWKELLWAVSTRMDPARDVSVTENTPVDYLDFASPVAGLGSKLGVDATNKWPGETQREWGVPVAMSDEVTNRIDRLWDRLNLAPARSALDQ